jgi:predicted MFS family arabinose efflux permease
VRYYRQGLYGSAFFVHVKYAIECRVTNPELFFTAMAVVMIAGRAAGGRILDTFFMPACMAYALEYTGSSGGGTVGTYQAFMDLGMALGPAVMGIILPLTGYRVLFLCLSDICLINMGYFQFYVRKRYNKTVLI